MMLHGDYMQYHQFLKAKTPVARDRPQLLAAALEGTVETHDRPFKFGRCNRVLIAAEAPFSMQYVLGGLTGLLIRHTKPI